MQISLCDTLSNEGVLNKKGLYKILNNKNGHWYIGSTIMPFAKRFLRHRGLLRKGNHPNQHLQNAYNKYGESNFSFVIVKESTDGNSLKEEQEIINQHIGKRYCYNISFDASAPMTGRKHTKEALLKMSAASKRNAKQIGERTRLRMLGTKHRPDSIEKMRKSALERDDSKRINVLKSKEFKEKISKLMKGRKFSPETMEKRRKIQQSQEYREKMSKVKTGFVHSDSTKSKQSKKKFGKEIILIKDGISESIISLRNFCGKHKLNREQISKIVNGKNKEYKGWSLAS